MSQQDPKLSIELCHVTVNVKVPVGYHGVGTENATQVCQVPSY